MKWVIRGYLTIIPELFNSNFVGEKTFYENMFVVVLSQIQRDKFENFVK